MALFRAFQTCTKRYLPWQAPYPLPMTCAPEPRQDRYAALFAHIQRNRSVYSGLLLVAGLGGIFNSRGDSNRPTMTGHGEIIYTSLRYQGGRGIQIGDVVHIRDITFGRRSEKKVISLAKRVVGLPGHKHYKKGRQAWHQVSVGRISTTLIVHFG